MNAINITPDTAVAAMAAWISHAKWADLAVPADAHMPEDESQFWNIVSEFAQPKMLRIVAGGVLGNTRYNLVKLTTRLHTPKESDFESEFEKHRIHELEAIRAPRSTWPGLPDEFKRRAVVSIDESRARLDKVFDILTTRDALFVVDSRAAQKAALEAKILDIQTKGTLACLQQVRVVIAALTVKGA